jgi:hypothetical protein
MEPPSTKGRHAGKPNPEAAAARRPLGHDRLVARVRLSRGWPIDAPGGLTSITVLQRFRDSGFLAVNPGPTPWQKWEKRKLARFST